MQQQQPNVPTTIHFQQQPVSYPSPAYGQAQLPPVFDPNSAAAAGDVFGQYQHQLQQLYAPIPAPEQQQHQINNNSGGQPLTAGGQFMAGENTQQHQPHRQQQKGTTPKGRPGRPPKLRDKQQQQPLMLEAHGNGEQSNPMRMAEENGQQQQQNGNDNGGSRQKTDNGGAEGPGERQLPPPPIEAASSLQQLGSQIDGTSLASHFPYSAPVFGPFDSAMGHPDYAAAWNGQLASGGGYPLAGGPPMACLGPDEIGGLGLYGSAAANGGGGLMPLSGYEHLDPMAGYGVWPAGGGYYLTAEQGKLLAADDNYSLNPVDRYGGAPPGAGSQSAAAAFYGPLQVIPPPGAVFDPTAFPGVSTLPPPPSQLASADQLYGLQNGFNPSSAHHEPLNSGLCNIGTSSLLQLDQQSGSQQQHPNQQHFYGQPPPTAELFGPSVLDLGSQQCGESAIKFGNAGGGVAAAGGQQQKTRPPPAIGLQLNSTPGKRSASKAQLRGAGPSASSRSRASSRPGTSAGQSLSERGGPSPLMMHSNEGMGSGGGGRKSRSRSMAKDSDDDSRPTEEREAERRNANNTRERIRVRDINSAFKELARLCCQHMPNVEERSLTKLGTLLRAVELIPLLEKKVEEKNRNMLDPRGECLKQRMMESAAAAAAAVDVSLGPGCSAAFSASSGPGHSSLMGLSVGGGPSGLQSARPSTAGQHFD